MSARGHLIILSGPAGAGKGTLRERLFREVPKLVYSISCTTRAPRPGERAGREYHFVNRDDFIALRDKGDFLEWAEVHGNFYGTRRSDVEAALDSGVDVVLEIDVVGAANVRRALPEAKGIFISPPSAEVLRERLAGRATETSEQLELRLRNAEREMARADEYDYIVVNDDLDRAGAELKDIVIHILEGER